MRPGKKRRPARYRQDRGSWEQPGKALPGRGLIVPDHLVVFFEFRRSFCDKLFGNNGFLMGFVRRLIDGLDKRALSHNGANYHQSDQA